MTETSLICPVCESGALQPHRYSDTFQHQGKNLVVDDLEGYLCPECGADPVFEDQIRRNHVRISDARREADGLLTGKQIRRLREHLGLRQRDASALFGGGANAFSKYERGEVIQSVAMDRLLRLVGRYPALLQELASPPAESFGSVAPKRGEYVGGDPVRLQDPARHGRPQRSDGFVVVSLAEWTQDRAA